MINNIDANEYYLNKYMDKLDKSERIEEEFNSEIEYDLEQILEHCCTIKRLSINYENEHNLEFNAKEIIIQFISDNL
jgi:hypothetical protein